MKKKFIQGLVFALTNSFALGSGIDSTRNSITSNVSFTSSNLSIVVINTHGQQIPDDYKIIADMGIIYNGEGVRNNLTDPFNNYNGKIGIEIRGSSSQMFPKKQYAVETKDAFGNDLDVSLLGFPPEEDWILYAPYNDKSLIRDVLVYKLANDMGRYATRSKYCELVLNGEYRGIYVLFEKIKRDANRVNIKKMEPTDISGDAVTGGYIIKIDKYDGENNAGWNSTYFSFPQANFPILYQYHVPKPDEIVQQQKSYIQNLIFNFETVMWYSSNIADSSTGYPKYIDIDSFVDFVLINELVKNVDAYRLSTFLYKDRDSRNPKLFAGPVWDFNLAIGNADYYEGWLASGWQLEFLTNFQNIPSGEPFLTPFWWRKLFDNAHFRNKMYARWQNLRASVLSLPKIFSYVDSLTQLLDESKTRNFEKYPELLGHWIWPNYFVGNTYVEEITYLKGWIANRINWMDANMVGEPSHINSDDGLPHSYSLAQNFPNPFNPTTTIMYSVPVETFISIKIYDNLGNEISSLINDIKAAGNYSVTFDGHSLSSGVYFCQMTAGFYISTKKITLLK